MSYEYIYMKSYTKSSALDKTKKEKQIAGLFEYHIFCSIRISDLFLSILDKFNKNNKSTKSQNNRCLILTLSSITKICLTTCSNRICIDRYSCTCRYAATSDDTSRLRFLNHRKSLNYKTWRNHTYHTIRISSRG
jgi:hypothetical protein